METHRIIRDEKLLLEFIAWLPNLQQNEVYFLCLQARKKYMPSIKSKDKSQLKRFVSNKERLFEKIKQLECVVGAYRTDDGEIITDDGIALYITTNPRDMKKATFNSIKSLVDLIEKDCKNLNPHSEVLSQIHKSKSRTTFVHFDIDLPTGLESDNNSNKCSMPINEIYDNISKIIGKAAFNIVKTRGGCHVLISPEKVVSKEKNWHPQIRSIINCDQSGDLMIPVVGCCQGGFVPHFYNELIF